MHVQYVALCDQVILGNDGRPSLIGVFNDLQVATIPFTLPRLAFAARILFTREEAGRSHPIEVVMTDPSGKEIGRPGGEVSLPQIPAGLESVAVDLPLQFDLFNVTNNNVIQAVRVTQNASNANQIQAITAPRVARFGVRVTW